MAKKKLKPKSKAKKGIKKIAKTLEKSKKLSSRELLKIKKADKAIKKLGEQSAALSAKIRETRELIIGNENFLKGKIQRKMELEDRLNSLLASSFSSEKKALEQITDSSKKEESALKARISCLQRITRIYDEKKIRILEAKKRQAFLKKQLERLNVQSKEWG
ncbi:MAG: hypothetical protein PHD95_05355 [Candidatus ainarchaeum sp.]|nr:hypothetical protein [Candidatus ainarchaeum sp.]